MEHQRHLALHAAAMGLAHRRAVPLDLFRQRPQVLADQVGQEVRSVLPRAHEGLDVAGRGDPDRQILLHRLGEETDLETAIVANAGHDVNLHFSAPLTFGRILRWMNRRVGTDPRVPPLAPCRP